MKNEIYVNFRDGNSILAKVLFDCVNIVFDCSITYQKKNIVFDCAIRNVGYV